MHTRRCICVSFVTPASPWCVLCTRAVSSSTSAGPTSTSASAAGASSSPSHFPVTTGNWGMLRNAVTHAESEQQKHRHRVAPLTPSLLATRHFQRSLPRLPVPPLEFTTDTYLDIIAPTLPPAQFKKCAALVRSFTANEGRTLQAELTRTDHANKHTSYISSDWFDGALKARLPLPFNGHSEILCTPDEDKDDMLTRAAFWVASSVQLYKLYINNTLRPSIAYTEVATSSGKAPPLIASSSSSLSFTPAANGPYYRDEWFERTIALCSEYFSATMMSLGSGNRALPQDLSEYDNLYNSTRIPGVLQDEIKAVGFMPHIIVQHKGHQYSVTVADAECNALPVQQIYARLRSIVQLKAARPQVDVSVFTSLPRTEWNAARVALLRSSVNQKSLEQVDTAMFVLNLDAEEEGRGEVGAVDFLCAAGGSQKRHAATARNRWWDKSISVNVGEGGLLTVGYEHSWGDGSAAMRYAEEVGLHTARCDGRSLRKDAPATESVSQLRWDVSPELVQVALRAERRLQRDIARFDTHTEVIDGLFLPTGGAEPREVDALVQLAVQVAWWRLNRSAVIVSERASLAHYLRGRGGVVHSTTHESQAFALAQCASAPERRSAGERATLCKAALSKYYTIKKDVHMGLCVDTHLFGLKCTSERMLGTTPALFQDPVYKSLAKPTVTVQPVLASSCFDDWPPSVLLAGFLPCDNGCGVSYRRLGDTLLLNVSAWRGGGLVDSPFTAQEFISVLCEALSEVKALTRVQ